ncbi:discoidin domain-containing protein [Clostridium sp. CCUG 7971]|uniref:endo-beta-N-acetylglucosaminidase n=1 Tax=Clostridium sp. CCUG 7971 TaxID=2811414 RepID=UPI001ABA866A|nr:discoidin domain-containing protein [Clostridium sp. CCUG 7971]MBO3443178.1 discoidin domain-containing protein [Clostridium sp. CCUG 7971]
MKHRKFISSAIAAMMLFSAIPSTSYAILESDIEVQEKTGQPFSSYWYPNELLKWNPQTDKDAKFNVGTVPLQERTDGEKLKNSQSEDAKVISLAIANKTTSSTPSQGKDKFDGYNFSYWQYIDTLVSWGGSGGEGLILSPSADLIDSAHINGVPVLGTVFFPPLEYGGRYEWMEEFLQKSKDGTFPMADKLVEVAKYYNFDGWFINQETGDRETIKPELAKLMKEFLAYLQKIKSDNMEIIWYDSMIDDGRVFWQNRLNDYNKDFLGTNKKTLSDGMFLNFWWTNEKYGAVDPENTQNRIPYTVTGKELKESAKLAKRMKRSPYDLYAGVDVQADGYNTKIKWDYLFPEGQDANTSLGLYCPSWTYDSSKDFDEFLAKENKFWVNESGDPREKGEDDWKGISNYIVEKSPVTSLPFVTNFSMGNGKFFNVNGKQVSDDEWNHRGMMDVMPTYRWVIDNKKNNLSADVDYTDSFYGGNSIALRGKLENGGKSTIKLYASEVDLTSNTEISLKYKSTNDKAKLKLELVINGKKKTVNLDTKQTGNWSESKASLGKFAGEELEEISLVIEGRSRSTKYKLNLGELSITDGNKGNDVSKISNLKVEDFKVIDNYYGNVRLTWDKGSNDVSHYEIYIEDSKGNKELIGATPTNAFYVSNIERELTLDTQSTFIVKPVSKLNQTNLQHEAKVNVKWPKLETPKANFEISSQIVAPGESITLSDKSLAKDNVKWKIEGLHKNEELSGEKITVKFDKPGVYSVTQIVSNPAGETINKKDDFIVVSNQAKGGLSNLALNKEAKANAQVNDGEAAKFAFDGKLSSKWCAFGEKGNWIEVDLGKEMTIKELRMSHAQAGGEARNLNTSEYTVEVSKDSKTWTQLKDIKGNTDAVSKDDLNYELARYVRVKINKSEQGSGGATRIYEIEVLGLDANKVTVIDNKQSLYKLNETIQKIEEEYKNLGIKDESFESILRKAKEVIDKVEVEKEEILKVESDLKTSFENLKNPKVVNEKVEIVKEN